jgi:DNA-binding MarR family transcriptional regulator
MPRKRDAGEVLYNLLVFVARQMPRDLSLTSASTLSTLERTGPRRVTELAAMGGLAQPSMTSVVAQLERSGLVERRPDPGDGRVVLVALTDAGLAYLSARRRVGEQTFTNLIDQLPAQEARDLRAAIPALSHLRDLCDPGPPAADPRQRSRSRAGRA